MRGTKCKIINKETWMGLGLNPFAGNHPKREMHEGKKKTCEKRQLLHIFEMDKTMK
jgi:hypothetical protein